MTREEWLHKLARRLDTWFVDQGGKRIPENVRISCGWPSSGIRKRIGECWTTTCSADGSCEIFVSPILAKPMEVADTLIHELVHATVGAEHKHKGPFRKLATAIGLEGKMTSTRIGDKLQTWLEPLLEKLGPYPHAQLTPGKQKKQSTRMCKVECPDCGYLVRTTRKWIEVGVPTCACGTEMQAV